MAAVTKKVHTICSAHPVAFDLFLLTVVYTLSHGLLVFNHGVFWDDWVIYNMDHALIIDRFKQTGLLWIGYLHIITLSGGVIAYRTATFVCYLLAAWCLYGVLKELKTDRYSRFFLVIFFALFPVNSARTAMIIMPYSICYALFFIGFWLTSRYQKTHSVWFRIPALVLLFISFTTNSLLVFYLIVILYIMYMERPENGSFSDWLRLVPRYADYLLLPILFWVIKKTYMKPYGLYADYNKTSVDGFSNVIIGTFRVFETSFLAVIDKSTGHHLLSRIFNKAASEGLYIPFMGIAIVIFVLFLCKRYQNKLDRESYETLGKLLLGGFAFWLAAFPYVAVGKSPQLLDWENRHQLLIPLGASLLLVYGVKLLSRRTVFTLPIYLSLIFIFIHADMLGHISFQRDWYKHLSLIENMRISPAIRNNTSFLFKDETPDLNCNSRSTAYYEYTGSMKEAFKEEGRFGCDMLSFAANTNSIQAYYDKSMNAMYNMKGFIKKEPDTIITIKRGVTRLGTLDVLKMMYWELNDKEKFWHAVPKIVSLEVAPL